MDNYFVDEESLIIADVVGLIIKDSEPRKNNNGVGSATLKMVVELQDLRYALSSSANRHLCMQFSN